MDTYYASQEVFNGDKTSSRLPETDRKSIPLLYAYRTFEEAARDYPLPYGIVKVKGEPIGREGDKFLFEHFYHGREEVSPLVILRHEGYVKLADVAERANELTAQEAELLYYARLYPAKRPGNVASVRRKLSHEQSAALGMVASLAHGTFQEKYGNACYEMPWIGTHSAINEALLASVAHDFISPEQHTMLAGPWESVMGPIFEEEARG